MTSKRKTPRKSAKKAETAAFVEALKRHGQLQTEDGPLKRGVTHVLKKTARGKPQLVRKRFSAI